MTDTDKTEFNTAVQAEVEKLLSSREEAQAREEAEAALKEAKETFETLRASLEAKDAKIKEYEEILAALDDDSQVGAAEVAANEKIVGLEKELEEITRRAEVAEAALETLAREETAAGRMAELAESGVCLDDEAAKAQYAKIREMSDEDFTSYKSELVALKSKYAPTSEEDGDEEIEINELSAQEVNLIAQSLGCDPADAQCNSLVNEVAQRVAEVSNSRRKPETTEKEETEEDTSEAASDDKTEELKKETASKKKMSLGEAISRSMDQEIRPSASLKEECTQAWEDYLDEKRGENKS
jgi:hypothetical protein